MVKISIRWFAKPVKRAERVDPMGVAILALSGTKYHNVKRRTNSKRLGFEKGIQTV